MSFKRAIAVSLISAAMLGLYWLSFTWITKSFTPDALVPPPLPMKLRLELAITVPLPIAAGAVLASLLLGGDGVRAFLTAVLAIIPTAILAFSYNTSDSQFSQEKMAIWLVLLAGLTVLLSMNGETRNKLLSFFLAISAALALMFVVLNYPAQAYIGPLLAWLALPLLFGMMQRRPHAVKKYTQHYSPARYK